MDLKVMTWNVENLFRPNTDAGPTSDDAYKAKLKTLSDGIAKLNADAATRASRTESASSSITFSSPKSSCPSTRPASGESR